MMRRFPTAVLSAARETGAAPSGSGTSTPSLDLSSLTTQLTTLGFRPAHVNSALTALQSAMARLESSSGATTDPFVLSLTMLSPLEATIEWLLLHLPEDDLPVRYRTTASSSDFVTGASKGGAVKGWVVDKLVKQAGFPRKAVEGVMQGDLSESQALTVLSRRLCGRNSDDGWGEGDAIVPSEGDWTERDTAREEEKFALEALLGERYAELSPTEYTVQIQCSTSTDEIHLHIIIDESSPYPSAQYPTHPPAMFISSPTIPSYMRLSLLGSLYEQFRDPARGDLRSILESGQGGAVFSMIEFLEQALPDIIDSPPDVGEVTRHLVPQAEDVVENLPARPKTVLRTNGGGRKRRVTEDDHRRAKERQARMIRDPKYEAMMVERRKLPAWKERERIVELLDHNRVLVVVGEVSMSDILPRSG